ncbi:MarR family winged helix-turn-helix transcriptional regulator [Ancylobacter pratisalsi]|uniref:Winged helix-turn-helix transcriptional regulator n=1 Tax=Ancylobacter pratisalsi TaxID=1745854 RepID=A0A6P1YRZ9_9HYPH|nr:MarR family winged helix-turn-helix transcriptional regulator [Ancylobacter pratisalsi]QIB35571.1 winged helix-turn-helix transcriptional regulator [Ancylobacter pratisalsi]
MGEKDQPRPLTTSRPALLSEGSDYVFREMIRELVDFAGRLQEIREAIARAMGLTPPQYNILMTLSQMGGDVTVTDLADRLRVSVPFIVTETRRLDTLGLLEKRGDPVDRRRVNLVLTQQALTALNDIAPLQVRVNDILFQTLGGRDLKSISRVTHGLLGSCDDALNEALAGGQPGR